MIRNSSYVTKYQQDQEKYQTNNLTHFMQCNLHTFKVLKGLMKYRQFSSLIQEKQQDFA